MTHALAIATLTGAVLSAAAFVRATPSAQGERTSLHRILWRQFPPRIDVPGMTRSQLLHAAGANLTTALLAFSGQVGVGAVLGRTENYIGLLLLGALGGVASAGAVATVYLTIRALARAPDYVLQHRTHTRGSVAFAIAAMPFVVAVWTGTVVSTYAWTVTDNDRSADDTEQVVAMRWGDGKYGRAFYGAQVYLQPTHGEYVVRARVHLGRGNGYFHDCGVIGKAKTAEEAVEKWSAIEFRDDGLHIGVGANGYFLRRDVLERHR